MTSVLIHRRQNRIEAFEMRGHTGYANAGEDIVCAALSAIAQTTVMGLVEVMNLNVTVERDDKRGKLFCTLPPDAPEEAQLLLRTLEMGIASIQSSYPKYIRMIYRERRE